MIFVIAWSFVSGVWFALSVLGNDLGGGGVSVISMAVALLMAWERNV